MRKLFSLLTAVLFAGSMMAGSYTITFKDNGSGNDDSNAGLTSTTVDDYVAGGAEYISAVAVSGKVYNGQDGYGLKFGNSSNPGSLTLTLASAIKPTSIVMNASPWGAKEGSGLLQDSVFNTTVTGAKGTFADFTYVYDGNTEVSTIVVGTQTKRGYVKSLTINFEGDTPGDEPGDEPGDVTADTLTCAAAAELALKGNTDEKIIKGYVTEIVEAWSTYKNVSFWMADAADGGQVFEAFRVKCETEAEAPIVGDLVWVKGNLTAYTKDGVTIAETTRDGSFGIIEAVERPVDDPAQNLGAKTIAEFLELKNTKDTCILTGVVANIKNTTYGNFDLVELDNEEVSVYVYGLLTAAGESKQFESLGVAEGDTLTCLAVYDEYNNAPQVKNAIFVSVKKAAAAPAQDIEITLSSLTTPGSLMWIDAVEEDGWWQILGSGMSYEFSLSNNYTTETAGVYTVDDLDPDYSFISIFGEKDTVDVLFVDGSVTVALSNEGIVTVKGTLVGEDGNNYIFDLTYKDPVAEKTVDIAISEWALIDDYVESNGLVVMEGKSDDGAYVQFSLWMPDGATEIYGNYTEEDFDIEYFGCFIMDADEAVPEIFSADIKVERAANDGVHVTANLLCYNNILYHVTTLNAQGFETVEEAVKATKTLRDGQLVIEKAGKRYNALGTVIR